MEKLVVLVTPGALEVFQVEAALNLAVTALESEVGEAVGALSSLVPDAAGLGPLADALFGEEVAALTGNALVVVVGLAVLDLAVFVFQLEGAVARLADVINLVLAPQDGVHDADVVEEGVALGTVGTGLSLLVGEFHAILNGYDAFIGSEEEACIRFNVP